MKRSVATFSYEDPMKLLSLTLSTIFVLYAQSSYSAGKSISEDDAKKIALAKVPGVVKEVEREKEQGRDEFSVEIVKDGKTFEVHIDPATGKIFNVEEETAGDGHE